MLSGSSEDDCTIRLHPSSTWSKKDSTCAYNLSSNQDRTDIKNSWFSCLKSKSQSRDILNTQQYTMINKSCSTCKDSSVKTQSCPSINSKDHPKKCGALSWSILPVALSIVSTIGFISTYFFAKSNCHIQKWIFPYLSYTGTEHPESMLFGLILNTEGFLGLIIMFLAWRYYRHVGQRGCLNHLALCFGGFSCFGVIMVGNFQVTKARIPHYVGAGMAFIIGTAYGVSTAILSRRAFQVADPPLRYGVCVAAIRAGLAVVMVLSLTCFYCLDSSPTLHIFSCGLVTGVGMYKKMIPRNDSQELDYDVLHMKSNGSCLEILKNIPPSERYIDLMGSLTEWLLTACLLICLSLFAYEFQTFQKVKVVLLRRGGPLRCNESIRCNIDSVQAKSRRPTSSTSYDADAGDIGKTVCGQKENACSHKYCPRPRFDSRIDSCEYQSKLQRSVATSCPFSQNLMTADSGIEDDVIQREVDVTAEAQKILYVPISKLQRTHSLPHLVKAEIV